MAQKCGYNLRDYAVSLISVEGLNFDCFLPLFGEKSIRVPVAVITDADPFIIADNEHTPVYPGADDVIEVSANTKTLLKSKDQFIGVFHGQKTLEYDLALVESNRAVMLTALNSLHPGIGASVEKDVTAAMGDAAKAKALFSGMFERSSNNVQKGRFGQALAQELLDSKSDWAIPPYIKKAIEHVCCGVKAQP
jgi:putative ATP-dependent endonuclease of OLD family